MRSASGAPRLSISCMCVCVQTLTDKEYQRLRDAAVAIIREMGVECGGSNVQMGINPADGVAPHPAFPACNPPRSLSGSIY